jgi:hypothetical protein
VQLSHKLKKRIGNNRKDTLALVTSAKVFGGQIRRFSYRESYGDSLSAFSARAFFSSIDLTRFSQVSIPAASVGVISGHADAIYSDWQGNNYATCGTMNFYYDKLRMRILRPFSSKGTGKSSFLIIGSKRKPAASFPRSG